MGRRGRLLRAAFAVAAIVLLLSAGSVLAALVRYDRSWPVPLPVVQRSTDAPTLARGRYIVYGPGRCADCHSPDSARAALVRGEDVPLTGGPGESTYLGNWTAPNLTPDAATGLGRVSDAAVARMLRYGVNRARRIALPFMDAYKDLTEDDLGAVISYLRSLTPAPGIAPEARVNLVGKIALAYFIEPYGPSAPPPTRLEPEASAAYGAYVANALAGCGACHTARNLRTGAYLSPPFSGGLPFKSRLNAGQVYVSPNLTPDADTGHITAWPEDTFVERFRAGLLIPDSPMPWGGFARMSDIDLRAVYRYLQSLPPVRHDVGPLVQPARGPAAG